MRDSVLSATKALGADPWSGLLKLSLVFLTDVDAPTARAPAAATRRMPALRALVLRFELGGCVLEEAVAELFPASSAAALSQLRSLTIIGADLAPAAASVLAATGWRLEALNLWLKPPCRLSAAGLAALVVQLPEQCVGALAARGPAPPGRGLLRLRPGRLQGAGRGLVARADLSQRRAGREFRRPARARARSLCPLPRARGGGPDLRGVELGPAGARLLASRRWARLRNLNLRGAQLGDAGVVELARGAWPALERLDLDDNGLSNELTLEDARRWAPAL
jgi:hypothetical protein